jgi:hypothetical protein
MSGLGAYRQIRQYAGSLISRTRARARARNSDRRSLKIGHGHGHAYGEDEADERASAGSFALIGQYAPKPIDAEALPPTR